MIVQIVAAHAHEELGVCGDEQEDLSIFSFTRLFWIDFRLFRKFNFHK